MLRRVALSLLIGSAAWSAAAQTDVTIAGISVRVPEEKMVQAPAWGISAESLLNVGAFAFDTADSGFTHAIGPGGGRYITGGAGVEEWVAPVSLPTGAVVTGFEVQGCDLSDSGQLLVLLVRQTTVLGVEGISLVGSPFFSGVPDMTGCGHFSHAFPTPATIDNTNAGYILDVQQSNDVVNGDLRFTTVRLRYHLQVSPAPAVATFGDVPTTHPFFRFVEALFASGITAGCGGGNFCPDNPLTRGEMAVFLAAALGLHFPN